VDDKDGDADRPIDAAAIVAAAATMPVSARGFTGRDDEAAGGEDVPRAG